MKNRKLFAWSLLGLLVLGFAASAAAAPTKLVFATRDVREVYPAIVEAFNKSHPDIQVELLPVPTDGYKNKLVTMFSAGVGPDVFFVFESDIPEWVRKGLMQNIDSFMASDKELNRTKIYDSTFEPMTYKGSVFGVSELVNPNGIVWYNQTMFDEAGLERPYDLSNKGRWTIDLMRQDAKKLSRVDGAGNRVTWGLNIPNWWGPLLSFIMGNGFSPNDAKGNIAINTPANLKAVEYLRSWTVDDNSTNAYDWPDEQGMFKTKNMAMDISGGWFTYVIDGIKPVEVGMAPMPVGITGQRASVISNPAIGMNPNSKNKEAAWTFMKYILVGDGARYRAQHESDLPSYKALLPLVKGKEGWDGNAMWTKVMGDSMNWAVPMPNSLTVRGADGVNNLLYGDNSLEAVWRGKAPAATILEKLQAQISAMPVIGE